MSHENPHTPQDERPLPPPRLQHARLGPLLGLIILVFVLVLGALFLRGSMLAQNATEPTPSPAPTGPEAIHQDEVDVPAYDANDAADDSDTTRTGSGLPLEEIYEVQ